MSFPSGKRVDPLDHSAVAARRARERVCAEDGKRDAEHWLRYAPLRVREDAAMRCLIGASGAFAQFAAAPATQAATEGGVPSGGDFDADQHQGSIVAAGSAMNLTSPQRAEAVPD